MCSQSHEILQSRSQATLISDPERDPKLELEDLFKNQSDLQQQIKSSIMEFNGFSFCKEQEVSREPPQNDEQEHERALEVDRFSDQANHLKGMSFGKQANGGGNGRKHPMPRVGAGEMRVTGEFDGRGAVEEVSVGAGNAPSEANGVQLE